MRQTQANFGIGTLGRVDIHRIHSMPAATATKDA